MKGKKPFKSRHPVICGAFILCAGCAAASGPAKPVGPEDPLISANPHWLKVVDIEPDTVPLLSATRFTIEGEGLDGARAVVFRSDAGGTYQAETPIIESSSRITARGPVYRKGQSAMVIVIDGSQPTPQADTIGPVLFAGPDPADPRVYEYRNGHGNVVRWRRSDMPLSVYIEDSLPSTVKDDLWRGITTWTDVVEPGVPSFVRIHERASANLVFEPGDSYCATYIDYDVQDTHRNDVFQCPLAVLVPKHGGHSFFVTGLGAHETGHMLCLLNHSSDRRDIMSGQHIVVPSQRDTLTLRHCYSQPLSLPGNSGNDSIAER